MPADRPARLVSPWVVVAIGFLGLALVFSARASVGVMMTEWETSLHWSRSFISGVAAGALVIMALTAPIAGNLADRLGPRALLTAGLSSCALGMAWLGLWPSQLSFVLGYGVLAAIGFGTVAMHVVTTAVARLFEARRGLATGMATAGATGGQLLIVPAISAATAYASWQSSLVGVAVACALLAGAAWLSLGAEGGAAAREAGEAALARDTLTKRLGHLVGQPVFHVLWLSFFVCGFTTTGAIETHLIPYATLCGFPPLPTATAYGVLSAVNLGGMVLSGWLCDRMSRPLLLGGIYVVRATAFLVLMNLGADLGMLFLFAVIFGLFDYSTVPPTAGIAASRLGLPIMGLAMGLISASHSLGGALGAFLGGWLFDAFRDYDRMWIAAAALAVAAGLMVWTLRETRPVAPPA